MDTLRGNFADRSDPFADTDDFDQAEDEAGRDMRPPDIGQDERRMQVRAYNHWASLLQERNFPLIEDLEPQNLPDFGPCSVLLDFTQGIEDPGISFIGDKLAAECGATEEIRTLSDVPSRSLLSRITDHYMQILANQAPIGFEAEFVDERGMTILYRGILLPFSSDDDTIDFIYGVINWKELADQKTTDELMLEIDQALDEEPEVVLQRHDDTPMTDWADGPAADAPAQSDPVVVGIDSGMEADLGNTGLPAPSFGSDDEDGFEDDEEFADASAGWLQPGWAGGATETEETDIEDESDFEDEAEPTSGSGPRYASLAGVGLNIGASPKEPVDLELDHAFALDDGEGPEEFDLAANYELDTDEADPEVQSATGFGAAPTYLHLAEEPETDEPEAGQPDADGPEADEFDAAYTAIELSEIDETEMELGDWLASARELALAARSSEDRTRNALYGAIGRAYDFSLAAEKAPEEFGELLADSGLTMQDRAPMTPVVKLVFGADYDKTRLTEYAAALSYAHRNRIERGTLTDYLRRADGGLKGVVAAERRARREEAGKQIEPVGAPRERIAKQLRTLEPIGFDALSPEGHEFALVMIRRTPEGEVVLLGEVPDDVSLIERAARKLLD